MPVLKNPRHERFAQLLASGKTADAAYQEAGYKPNRGNAVDLKAKQNIQDRISELLTSAGRRVEITIARVLEELGKMGFANMIDYVQVGADGNAYVDLSELNRDTATAIQEVTVDEYTEGKGDDARDVKRVKFKLADKRAALVDIGKHLGMFKELVEHTGKDGGPIETVDVTDYDRAKAIASLVARTKASTPAVH